MQCIKEYSLKFLIFIIIFFLLDFSIGYVLRKLYFRSHNTIQISIEDTKADLLILGSSEATHHYVPDVFEKTLHTTFYNTGLDGSSILYQSAIFNSLLKRYTPKMIILDSPGNFNIIEKDYDIVSSSLLPFYATHPELRPIIRMKDPFSRIKNISGIYPFNSKVFDIFLYNYKQHNANKGYAPLYRTYNGSLDSSKVTYPYRIDSVKLQCLNKVFVQARLAGVKMFVCYSPAYRILNKKQLIEFEITKSLCEKYGVKYFDYRADTTFINHKNLFQDGNHMNSQGATLFSNELARKIQQEVIQASVIEKRR